MQHQLKFYMQWFLILFFVVGSDSAQAQVPNTLSAIGVGGIGSDAANSMAIDAAGNIYVTGFFYGTVDFAPGPTVTYLSSTPSNTDVFICKYSAAGALVWARSVGGAGYDEGLALLEDGGNVYITGYFNGTIDLNPGPGTANYTSFNGKDIFLLKLDVNGDFEWANAMGHNNDDKGVDLAKDAFGNIYVTGMFGGTVDFEAGPGTTTLSTLGNSLDMDIFVCKYTSSGALLWAKSISGPNDGDGVCGIELDAAGNIYTSGYFELSADFDPGPGSVILSSVSSDMFTCKWNNNADYVWAKQVGGASGYASSWDLTLDAAGNVYTTGRFSGTLDFDPGPGVANFSMGGFFYSDIFVSKLSSTGNYVWTKTVSSPNDELPRGIAVDAGGNVYCTGHFTATTDFDPGPGVFNMTSAGTYDIFVFKLNPLGNLVWAKGMGGANTDRGMDIKIGPDGNVYTTGLYEGPANLNAPGAPFILNGNGFADIYIIKIENLIALPVSIVSFVGEATPSGNRLLWTTEREQNSKCFVLQRSTDAVNFSDLAIVPTLAEQGNSQTPLYYNYLDQQVSNGIVYYRLNALDVDGNMNFSQVVQITNGSKTSLTCWPNPTSETLFVSIHPEDLGKELTVLDANGHAVYRQKVVGIHHSVHLHLLPSGTYFIRLGSSIRQFSKW